MAAFLEAQIWRANVDQDRHYSFVVALWSRAPLCCCVGSSTTAYDYAPRLAGRCLSISPGGPVALESGPADQLRDRRDMPILFQLARPERVSPV